MGFLKQLFGREDSKLPQASRLFLPGSSMPSQDQKTTAAEISNGRRELLHSVLRNTLARHGIPASWLGAEMLVATSRGRETGMHWRLLVRHWEPRLLTHMVALQNSLVTRLLSQDPLAADWLTGISWQFALPDEAACPALPQPGYWTADPRPAPAAVAPDRRSGADVIAGPVRITTPQSAPAAAQPEATPDSADSVRHDLDRLLAVRDAEMKRHAQAHGSSEPTQPMYLRTEPQPLEALRRREG